MQRFLLIPVMILAGFLLAVAGRTELPASNTASAVFAVH